jgi:hypothetical protein
MSLEINADHKCDSNGCRSEADDCYCSDCINKLLEDSYNDGYRTAKKEDGVEN